MDKNGGKLKLLQFHALSDHQIVPWARCLQLFMEGALRNVVFISVYVSVNVEYIYVYVYRYTIRIRIRMCMYMYPMTLNIHLPATTVVNSVSVFPPTSTPI